jgi:hypothetical protein
MFWNESSSSNGGGIQLYNSNGNREFALATDNPNWEIQHGNGTEEIYSGDGYDRWIRFTVTIDWGVGEFSYEYEDLQSGTLRTGSGRPLQANVDISYFTLDHYSLGNFAANGETVMWFDNIRFDL